MRRTGWALLAALGLWLCAQRARGAAPVDLRAAVAAARAQEAAGLYDQAIAAAAQIAKAAKDPFIVAEAEVVEGDALIDSGHVIDAQPIAQRAADVLARSNDPDGLLAYDEARMELGEIDQWGGKLDAAMQLYQAVLARERSAPGVPRTQLLAAVGGVGATYALQGKPKEAWPYMREAAEMARAELPVGNLTRLYALTNALSGALSLNRFDEAQVWLDQIIADCPPSRTDCDRGTPVHIQGFIDQRLGRTHDAERAFAEAAEWRTRQLGPDNPKVAESLNDLAVLLRARGDDIDGLPVQKRAASIFAKAYGANSPLAIQARLLVVDTYTELQQFAEADALIKAIQVDAKSHPVSAPGIELIISVCASRLNLAEGKPELALLESEAGIASASPNAQPYDRALAYDAEGAALLKLHRRSEALAAEQAALKLHLLAHAPTAIQLATPYLLIAAIELELRDYPQALVAIDKARGTVPPWLEPTGGASDQSGLSPRWSDVRAQATSLELKALWSMQPGRAVDRAVLDRAFEAAQGATSGDASDALAIASAERSADSDEVQRAAQTREATLQDLRSADRAWAQAFAARATGKPSDVETLLGKLKTAEAAFLAADAALQKLSPRYARLRVGRGATLEAVQTRLHRDEALMFLLSDDEATNVFLITADGADWKRLNLSADGLCGRVARLRAALSPGDGLTCAGAPAVSQGATLGQPGARGMVGSRPVVAYDRAAAYALWRDLFQPFAGQLRGRSRLIVATDGPLIDLPLGALVVRRPVGRDDDAAALRQTEWLVRSLAVSLLPEPGLLPLLRQPGPVRSSVGFVGVGAPCRSSCRGPGEPPAVAALDDSLAHLPPLPGSASELKAMAAAAKGPATLLIGADATEQKVLNGALSHHDVIAFATHGLRQDEFGAPEPSLVLSLDPAAPENPGLLSASIIARDLKVDASWVILSACDTAAPDARSHDAAFSGLSRAFFAAGARSVLVSYAAVDDDIAQRLTVPTVSSSLAHAEALRRAEMSVLVDSSRPSFAEPKTWAMFALVGDGD